MTPSTTPPSVTALASALVQLTALDRGELTVVAAAAQALATAQPHRESADHATLSQGSRPSVYRGGARRRSKQRCDTRDAPGRHVELGYSATGDRQGKGTTIAADAEVDHPVAGRGGAGAADGGANTPRLMGRGQLHLDMARVVDPELFSSQAYRRRLGPTVPGLLYAGGCDGLLALAQRLDRPLYKVGTTEAVNAAMRMSTLAATRYGSVVRTEDGWQEEGGFEHWRAVALPLARQRGRGSPVRSALKAVAYERPASLPHGALDRAVAAALAPAGLDAFAASPEGRAACDERGVDPACLDRYSPAPLGCAQGRYEQARELVLLGPRADADRLAAVLEAVIVAHVMGWDTEVGNITT